MIFQSRDFNNYHSLIINCSLLDYSLRQEWTNILLHSLLIKVLAFSTSLFYERISIKLALIKGLVFSTSLSMSRLLFSTGLSF